MNNDEAIKVMETLMELPKTFQVNGGDLRDAAALAIEALEEKRPSGYWKTGTDEDGSYQCCSVCGKVRYRYPFTSGAMRRPHFCEYCGADMRKEEET